MKYYLRMVSLSLVILLNSIVISHCQEQAEDLVHFYESYRNAAQGNHGDEGNAGGRTKRMIPPGMGGSSCLQIYSVPQHSVQCEPTTEVRDALADLHGLIDGNTVATDALSARVDTLDPDKPKELPAEVKERLETIDNVKLDQAGQAEYIKRLEGEIGHVTERIEAIETSDRLELAQLIQLQTNLIQSTLHQSNLSIHDAYIDRLAESTTDLTDRLMQLQLELTIAIHDSETKLEEEVKKIDDDSKTTINSFEETLREQLLKAAERLDRESSIRLRYQNQTEGNYRDILKLVEAVTTIREHQSKFEDNEEVLKERLEDLEKKLVEEREEKISLQERTNKLSDTLQILDANYVRLARELGQCRNQTGILTEEFKALSQALMDKEHLMPKTLKVGDCQDALNFFQPASGIYAINIPPLTQPFDVYCDMDGNHGWTVIQRRQDGSVDFFRGWQHYKDGFGDVSAEFWLGLTKIHALTNRKSYRLRLDMRDWDDKWYFAEYSQFKIDTEENNYKLNVSGYHGNAGDSLAYHQGMPFSTMDRNNDENAGICATWCHGAWWYKDCFHSNLNGRFYNTGPYVTKTGWGDGVVWRHIQGTNFYSLKSVVMKIRPNDQET